MGGEGNASLQGHRGAIVAVPVLSKDREPRGLEAQWLYATCLIGLGSAYAVGEGRQPQSAVVESPVRLSDARRVRGGAADKPSKKASQPAKSVRGS